MLKQREAFRVTQEAAASDRLSSSHIEIVTSPYQQISILQINEMKAVTALLKGEDIFRSVFK